MQIFHAKVVCPTFWDRPPSLFNFSAFSPRVFSLFNAGWGLKCYGNEKAPSVDGAFVYLKDGAWVSPFAKAFGPGLDIEKYIFAAFVVPKSLFEPVS